MQRAAGISLIGNRRLRKERHMAILAPWRHQHAVYPRLPLGLMNVVPADPCWGHGSEDRTRSGLRLRVPPIMRREASRSAPEAHQGDEFQATKRRHSAQFGWISARCRSCCTTRCKYEPSGMVLLNSFLCIICIMIILLCHLIVNGINTKPNQVSSTATCHLWIHEKRGTGATPSMHHIYCAGKHLTMRNYKTKSVLIVINMMPYWNLCMLCTNVRNPIRNSIANVESKENITTGEEIYY